MPFALFISLAANEQTLPGTAGGLPFGGAPAGAAPCCVALLPSHLKAQHQHRVPLLTAIVLLDQALLGGGHSARCQSASTKAAKPAALISAVQLSPSDLSTPCCRYSITSGVLAGGASRGKGTRSFALSVFNMLKAKRDQLFPSASPERARLKPHTV